MAEKQPNMTKEELLEKFDEIDRMQQSITEELAALKQYVLSIEEPSERSKTSETFPSPDVPNYTAGYTLDDLYKAFGNKKQSYAQRLKTALRRKQITSLEDFLLLTPSELLELDNVGYGTLQKTQAALKRLGIDW